MLGRFCVKLSHHVLDVDLGRDLDHRLDKLPVGLAPHHLGLVHEVAGGGGPGGGGQPGGPHAQPAAGKRGRHPAGRLRPAEAGGQRRPAEAGGRRHPGGLRPALGLLGLLGLRVLSHLLVQRHLEELLRRVGRHEVRQPGLQRLLRAPLEEGRVHLLGALLQLLWQRQLLLEAAHDGLDGPFHVWPALDDPQGGVLQLAAGVQHQLALPRVVDEHPGVGRERVRAQDVLDQVRLAAHPDHGDLPVRLQGRQQAQRGRDPDTCRHCDDVVVVHGSAVGRGEGPVHVAGPARGFAELLVHLLRPVALRCHAHQGVVGQGRMHHDGESVPLVEADPREADVDVAGADVLEARRVLPGHEDVRVRAGHGQRGQEADLREEAHEVVQEVDRHRDAHHPEDVARGRVEHQRDAPGDAEVVRCLPALEGDPPPQATEHHGPGDQRRQAQAQEAGDARLVLPEELDLVAKPPAQQVPEGVGDDLEADDGAGQAVQVVEVVQGQELLEVARVQEGPQVVRLRQEEEHVHGVVEVGARPRQDQEDDGLPVPGADGFAGADAEGHAAALARGVVLPHVAAQGWRCEGGDEAPHDHAG
mmetsp:Transcript_84198/g.261923  ORF Transcript_84198/g.261923 Transcript_84198/m.261923 type:complete len:586 (+) Transcript_84198:310-2067(+)